jgi:hypothetical protein
MDYIATLISHFRHHELILFLTADFVYQGHQPMSRESVNRLAIEPVFTSESHLFSVYLYSDFKLSHHFSRPVSPNTSNSFHIQPL